MKSAARMAALLLLLLVAVDISIGADIARLTVINETEHYVHIIVDGDPFLYVSPGSGATFEKEGYSTVVAKVFYAPGQGIEGSVERSFVIAPYEPESTGCDWVTFECETTTASGGPRSWTVTADSLAASETTGETP